MTVHNVSVLIAPNEHRHFAVPEQVYVYIRQLENAVRNPLSKENLVKLYPFLGKPLETEALFCVECSAHETNEGIPPCPLHQQHLESDYYDMVAAQSLLPAGDESTFYQRRDAHLKRRGTPS